MFAAGSLPGSHSDPGGLGSNQKSAFLRSDLVGSPPDCPVRPALVHRLVAELRRLRLAKLQELDKVLHRLGFKLQKLHFDLLKLLVL